MGVVPSKTELFLPSDTLRVCTPDRCWCRGSHCSARYVYVEKNCIDGRERFHDPVDMMGEFLRGGLWPMPWKDAREWTVRDYERLGDILNEYYKRERGRRTGPGISPYLGLRGDEEDGGYAIPMMMTPGGPYDDPRSRGGPGRWHYPARSEFQQMWDSIDEKFHRMAEDYQRHVAEQEAFLFGSEMDHRKDQYRNNMLKTLQELMPQLSQMMAAHNMGGAGMNGMMGNPMAGMNPGISPFGVGMSTMPGMSPMGGLNHMHHPMAGMGPRNHSMMGGLNDYGMGMGRPSRFAVRGPRRGSRLPFGDSFDEDDGYGGSRGWRRRGRRRFDEDDEDDFLGGFGNGSRSPKGPSGPRMPRPDRGPGPYDTGGGGGGGGGASAHGANMFSHEPQQGSSFRQRYDPFTSSPQMFHRSANLRQPNTTSAMARGRVSDPFRAHVPQSSPLSSSPVPAAARFASAGSTPRRHHSPSSSFIHPDVGASTDGTVPYRYRTTWHNSIGSNPPPTYTSETLDEASSSRPAYGKRRVSFRPDDSLAKSGAENDERDGL